MHFVRVAAVAVLAFVLQIAVVSKVRIFGVHPDILFLLALAVTVTAGRNQGALAGFAAGLCADVFMTSPLGLSALSYSVVCYAVGTYTENTSRAASVVALVGMVGAFAGFVLLIGVGAITGEITTSFHHAMSVVFVEVLVAAVITPMSALLFRSAWLSPEPSW